MPSSRQRGEQWESTAETFLHKRGLSTLTRNFHSRFGEIDLIMVDRGTLVFTEVRFRAGSAFGSGAESVTFAKQRRIISAAGRYLQLHPRHRLRPCRFDVISISRVNEQAELEWIQGAFDA